MSTRATYEIDGTTIYVHTDGYPEGAAAKFYAMIRAAVVPDAHDHHGQARRKGGLAFAFIRGNLEAEPTESHEIHGDTEHRYQISSRGGRVIVSHSPRKHGPLYQWTDWEAEPLADFINRHYPGAIATVEAYSYFHEQLVATRDALAIAEHCLEQSRAFDEGNPNRAGYAARGLAFAKAATATLPARIVWLRKERLEAERELEANRGQGWARYYERRLAEINAELDELGAAARVADQLETENA